MPFTRPNLSQLVKQAQAAFDAKLPGADARLKKSVLNIAAAVMAGLVNGVYGYLDYLAQNLLPQNADAYTLLRQGALYGLSPTPAMAASGVANFTGVDGTAVPSGTQLQDSAGNLYATTADANLGVGATAIPVAAQFGGADGNLEAGAPLNLAAAISGVDAIATVDDDGFSGGADAEDIPTAFRARLIARIQTPPGGSGTVSDYEKWTREATPGVTRVTVAGGLRGAGTVDLRFLFDGRADPVPLSADLASVLAAVQANAPLTDVPGIQAIAPVAEVIDYTLPVARFSTPEQQSAAVQALSDMHLALKIGDGLSIQANAVPALAAVPGQAGASSVVTSPSVNIDPDPTKFLQLGNVVFS